MQFRNAEAAVNDFCAHGLAQTDLEVNKLKFWEENIESYLQQDWTDHAPFLEMVGSWLFFVMNHRKVHGSSMFTKESACQECLWSFFASVSSRMMEAIQGFKPPAAEDDKERPFEWKNPQKETWAHCYEPHKSNDHESDAKSKERPQESDATATTTTTVAREPTSVPFTPEVNLNAAPSSAAPITFVEEAECQTPSPHHAGCTTLLAYKSKSPSRLNPPSIILTRINDDNLLNVDKNLDCFCETWTEWCSIAFDDCPPKFNISNIDHIKRKGSSALTISFHERPKKSLIRYFTNCVSKHATTCRAFVFKENYTFGSPSPRPTRNSITVQQQPELTLRSPPQPQRRPFAEVPHRSSHYNYNPLPLSCFSCGHHWQPQPFTTPQTPPFTKQDRLAQLEMKLDKVTQLIATLLQ